MATMDGSAVLVDTNVLLTATTPERPLHERAMAVLNGWPNRGVPILTSGQILREYLVVATRPIEVNGLGLAPAAALENVEAIAARLRYLDETEAVSERLLSIMGEVPCSGKQIHDANLVALALTHRAKRLVTGNTDDFARFDRLIEVLDLADVEV